MSVIQPDRDDNEFSITTKATGLCRHTINCCNNKNIFKEELDFNGVITSTLVQCSLNIARYCFEANEKDVRRGTKNFRRNLDERIVLQEKAISECNNMLFFVNLAKKQFKFPSKKLKYWTKTIKELRGLIQSWKESDIKRKV